MTDTTLPPDPDNNAPIDAEFEPAQPRPSLLAGRRGPNWLAFLILGGISLLSFALAAAAFGLIPGLKAGSGEIADLKAEIAVLKTERDMAQQARAEMVQKITNSDAKLSVLKSTLDDTSDALAVVENRIELVRDRVDDVAARPEIGATIDPETGEPVLTPVNPLVLDRLETLERAISTFPADEASTTGGADALLAQIAELRVEIESLREAGVQPNLPLLTESENLDADAALALSAIEAAARRGQPFQSGYQRLVSAMPDNRQVKALQPLAETGAPTLAELREQFSGLARRALDAEAARIGGGTNWMRSIFGDGITIRRADEDDAGNAIDKATISLSQGDLAAAITQIETLDTDVQAVFTDWLNNARKRQSLEDGLEALRLAMIAKDRP